MLRLILEPLLVWYLKFSGQVPMRRSMRMSLHMSICIYMHVLEHGVCTCPYECLCTRLYTCPHECFACLPAEKCREPLEAPRPVHARMHACTRARVRACTHAQTEVRMHGCTLGTHACMHSGNHVRTHSRSHMHTRTHTHTSVHTYTYTHTHSFNPRP